MGFPTTIVLTRTCSDRRSTQEPVAPREPMVLSWTRGEVVVVNERECEEGIHDARGGSSSLRSGEFEQGELKI
jgi:hypothetical protein